MGMVLHQLSKFVTNHEDLVFVSDRHPSIFKGISKVSNIILKHSKCSFSQLMILVVHISLSYCL